MEEKKLDILIIQKDDNLKNIFKNIIIEQNLNYNCEYLNLIFDTQNILSEKSFDIIIMDFYLKDGSVFDLLKFNIPIIFLTESGNESSSINAIKKGAGDFIIKDTNNNYIRILPVYIEKVLVQKKEELNKMKTQNNFFAMASHELRTPLNSILGFASLLHEEETDPQKNEKLRIIKDSGKYLLNIINDILDLSKIQSRKLEIENINFLLINTLKHVENLFSIISKEKEINLIMNIDSTVPNIVNSDELRISQILINIISNAFKFTDIGGTISIVCSYNNGFMKFKINDTGIGIPKEKLDHIFNAFEQVNSSITRKYGGTGLGLTISRELLDLMGGKIEVESEENKGTKFTIELPLKVVDLSAKNKSTLDLKDYERGEFMVKSWANNMSNDPRLLALLFNAVKKIPARMKLLEKALVKNNYEEIKYLTHQIRGFTGSYGIEEIYRIIIEMDDEINLAKYDIVKLKNNYIKLRKIISIIPRKYLVENGNKNSNITQHNINPSIKILVAEDNYENQKLIEAYLNSVGLKCDFAENGLITLNMMRKKEYNTLILDMQMPVMNGFETIKNIDRQNLKNTIVIALTADNYEGIKEKIISSGCNDCLTKPIDKKLLIERISSLNN